MVSIWFDGVEKMNEVTADLEADQGAVGAKGAALIRKYALQVEGTAKLLCPVDTGHLKSTIGPPDIQGDGRFGSITATITASAHYAGYVEWGTRYMAPQAFMGPALDRHAPEFVEAVSRLGNPLGARSGRG